MTMATIERLRGALQALLEATDLAPERNCNCTSHLAPPCGDCVEWAALREARQQAESVMAEPYLAAAAELQPVQQPADAPRYIELANPAAEDDPDAAARAYAARMGDRWEHMGEEARQRARELAAQRMEPPL